MLDWVVGVVGLVTALYLYLTWHYGYWKAQGVYSPPGIIPGIGHMWEVFTFKKSVHWLQCEIYDQTRDWAAVGLYDFRQPVLLVRALPLVQSVLVSDFSSFHDNPMEADENLDPHIARNPFLLNGERWKTLRQKLTPGLSSARIKTMFPMMEKVCQEFNRYMEKHLNEEIDVKHITGLFTSEVIAKCAFAVEGDAFNDPNAKFYQQGRELWDGSLFNQFFMLIFTHFPFINKILRQSMASKELIDFFGDLIKQAAKHREQNPDKAPQDYLQFLLTLSKKDKDFTMDDVLAQSLTFFTDGFETTSMVVSFLLYELTVNPELQGQLRQDLRAAGPLTWDIISSLPLLDRVLSETLRKYGPITIARVCTRDTELQADDFSCKISKGTQVVIPVYAIHRDPEIYPDPDKFDPDRFLPENSKTRHPTAFMGFGAGPRTCIGYRVGTMQVKVLVANILTNFRLLPCSKTAQKMKLLKTFILPVSDVGIWIKLEKL